MADSKKYDGSQWEHSLRKLTTATEAIENPLYSDGTAITAYTIKGNTVQSGTPTPSAPISVTGVGNKTANLWSEGNISIALYERRIIVPIVLPVNTYTMSFIYTSANITSVPVIVEDSEGILHTYRFSPNQGRNYVTIDNLTDPIASIYLYSADGYSASYDYAAEYTDIMLAEGSSTEYEPYGYKIPILNNSQTIDIYIGDLPLLKSLDGTAVDEISNGTLTRRVDSDGSVLPTPTTTQITMPSIPTTEGANSITVDTTVQPSEFTATWTGWHNASVKEYDGTNWQ